MKKIPQEIMELVALERELGHENMYNMSGNRKYFKRGVENG